MLSRGGVRQNLRRLYFQRMISKNINICTYLHGHFRVSELQLHQEMTLFDATRFSCASNRHRKHVTPETKKNKNKTKIYLYIRHGLLFSYAGLNSLQREGRGCYSYEEGGCNCSNNIQFLCSAASCS